MRVHSHITFSAGLEESQAMLRAIGHEKDLDSSMRLQAVNLFTDSREYEILMTELRNRGIKYHELLRKEFTPAELGAAEFLWMISGDPWGYPEPQAPPGYRQLCYDLSTACPMCGNGARQRAPFMLKKAPPSRREWWMLNWVFEYLVTDRIADLVRQRGFTGCEFWPLLHYKKKVEISGWKQLVITHELPPMSARTELPIVDQEPNPELEKLFGEASKNPSPCPCGKRGRNLPDTMYYDREHMACFKDFNKSAEWLGGGATTWQMKIISQRVFRFLREQRLDTALFTPIEWV